jgi:hypothetical protein
MLFQTFVYNVNILKHNKQKYLPLNNTRTSLKLLAFIGNTGCRERTQMRVLQYLHVIAGKRRENVDREKRNFNTFIPYLRYKTALVK